MPQLLLGPLLRYVSDTDATIWVETDAPCTVRVLDGTAPTFCVAGHHYALVVLEDLEPGSTSPYTVELDGETVWPPVDDPFPPCVIRTHAPEKGKQLKLAFGSCRVSVPHDHPYSMQKDDDERGREVDALLALVERMRHEPPAAWPDALLLLGDQVYADEVSPKTRELIDR
ncbi:MAG: alkaline phosphatase family protein, partial [Actinomycetota bacterium]|nr:alkaline phosphatase family protein [Actinomycetota bacterium]